MPISKQVVLLLILLASPWSCFGDPATHAIPDLMREQRLAAEASGAILDGQSMALQAADGQQFLAIHTQASAVPPRGTVIILHGRGLHPDAADVVHPLRVGLAEHGWDTLSIQLPVLSKDARYFDYLPVLRFAMPRIEAATAWAREAVPGQVVLLAHSCGSHMAQHWVHARGEPALARFDAFVGIGMGATDRGQPMSEPFALEKMPMPVLDVYAEYDFPAVHRLAPARLAAIRRAGSPLSRQMVVADADHYFVDRGPALLEVVSGWLRTLP